MKTLLWIVIALAAGLYICGPVVDPDLWWHITIGRWIIAHRDVPVVDHWTLFGQGEVWRAYSWMIEILFALVDRVGGVPGLMVLQQIFAAIVGLSFCYCLSKIAGDWFFGLLVGVYATAACFNHFTLRPQTLVWVYLVSLLYLGERIAQEGVRRCLLASVFFIMMLWANTHISTVLGLSSLGAWLLFNRDLASSERVQFPLRSVFLVVGVGFLGTLCTPYFGGEWLTFSQTASHPFFYTGISEFQPATILMYSTGFLIILAALLLLFLHRASGILEYPKLLMGALFVVAGLAVVKFLPFAFIYLAALLANLWRRAAQRPEVLGQVGEALRRFRALCFSIPREGLTFVFLVTIIVNCNKNRLDPISEESIAVEPVSFMVEHKVPLPILNAFGEGGYLMYRYSDAAGVLANKVTIDGRTNLIDEKLWNMFNGAFEGRANWKEYIQAVNPETILWRTASPLVSILKATGEWCLVYQDQRPENAYSVFVSRRYWESHPGHLRSTTCGVRL